MIPIVEALTRYADIDVFQVDDTHEDDPTTWRLLPTQFRVLPPVESLYILKAINVRPDGTLRACHIDMILPERYSDYVYTIDAEVLTLAYHNDVPGDVVCAVPIDTCGQYRTFYSKQRPDIGIAVLQRGLALSTRQRCIAEDLGYILRDERRFAEAAAAFAVSVREGPSDPFIIQELARCYKGAGEAPLAEQYEALYQSAEEARAKARQVQDEEAKARPRLLAGVARLLSLDK